MINRPDATINWANVSVFPSFENARFCEGVGQCMLEHPDIMAAQYKGLLAATYWNEALSHGNGLNDSDEAVVVSCFQCSADFVYVPAIVAVVLDTKNQNIPLTKI